MFQESNKMDSVCNNRMVRGNILPNLGNTTELLDTGNARFAPEEEFDDCDLDDDIDPALKEEIDRWALFSYYKVQVLESLRIRTPAIFVNGLLLGILLASPDIVNGLLLLISWLIWLFSR